MTRRKKNWDGGSGLTNLVPSDPNFGRWEDKKNTKSRQHNMVLTLRHRSLEIRITVSEMPRVLVVG